MEQKDTDSKQLLGVILATALATLTVAVVLYALVFREQSVAADAAAWGQFGDYLGGTVGPIMALLALIALLKTIVLNERELRYTRHELKNSTEALRQSNEISMNRAKKERLEAQKADIYRIIGPLTDGIDSTLRRQMAVPQSIHLSSGRTVKFSGEHVIHELFTEKALREYRDTIAGKNSHLLGRY